MRVRPGLDLIALLLWSSAATAAPQRGEALFTKYNAASFRKLPEASASITPQQLDRLLLDAAIFHETNRRRTARGLRALRYDAKVREAAAIQSQNMASKGQVTHENSDPNAGTMIERARLAGLSRPAFIAENVASAFGRRYRSGEKFYVREENGRRIYSYEPNGPPIPMHTYVSFARALVDSWMESPGHRRNIMAKDAAYLGCSSVPSQDRTSMESFYCTQVFHRPLE